MTEVSKEKKEKRKKRDKQMGGPRAPFMESGKVSSHNLEIRPQYSCFMMSHWPLSRTK
jgi:hypothetical protein